MNIEDYPNRESWVAARAARRRALKALDTIEEHASTLRRRIEGGYAPYGTDAQRFGDSVIGLGAELSAMETIRAMLEWHAADKAEASNDHTE